MNHPDFFSFLLTGNLQFFHALLASLALLLSRLWVESLQAREAAWQGPTVKRERTLHLSFGKHWRYRLALMSPPCSPSTLASASGGYNKFVYTHTHTYTCMCIHAHTHQSSGACLYLKGTLQCIPFIFCSYVFLDHRFGCLLPLRRNIHSGS